MPTIFKLLLLGLPYIVEALERRSHRKKCIKAVNNLRTQPGKTVRDTQRLYIAGEDERR